MQEERRHTTVIREKETLHKVADTSKKVTLRIKNVLWFFAFACGDHQV